MTFGGCPWGRARQRKYGVRPDEPKPEQEKTAPCSTFLTPGPYDAVREAEGCYASGGSFRRVAQQIPGGGLVHHQIAPDAHRLLQQGSQCRCPRPAADAALPRDQDHVLVLRIRHAHEILEFEKSHRPHLLGVFLDRLGCRIGPILNASDPSPLAQLPKVGARAGEERRQEIVCGRKSHPWT